MLEQDYFMRMISRLSAVLAEVLFHKKAQQLEEARGGVHGGVRSLLGFDPDILHSFSDAQILELLNFRRSESSTSGEPDVAKCYAAAILLKEEAEIDMLEGKNAAGINTAAKALSLMLELFLSDVVELPATAASDALIEMLSPYELPLHIGEKIFRYYELTRQYGKAEDILFELVERSRQFGKEGVKFYERLLQKSDGELQAGNLPRGEAEESAAELHKIIGLK
jgi:hypothetical protein